MSFENENIFRPDSEYIDENIFIDVNKRNVKFFPITGSNLVYPFMYEIQEFQKNIIKTSIFNNTIICLPSGLGKSYLSAIITLNFQRWFLNGKILILSQNKNLLSDQLKAHDSYTMLSKELFAEINQNISPKECTDLWNKSIILTTPQKLLDNLNANECQLKNLILLIILETNKIVKCQEYIEVINKLNVNEFRILVFIDTIGFNSKIIRQVVEMFNISKLEIRNISSPDIKNCTFCSEIESVVVDVSKSIISLKDSFYTIFEKYSKKLKDAKIITGNVVCLTKAQIQKFKEKFLKNNSNFKKNEQEEFLNCLTMCTFLCQGFEILHNWGIRTFYNYLFADSKEDNLKHLIANDECLKIQMKSLNEYLKINAQKRDIVHPKLLCCKDMIARFFSYADTTDISETELKTTDPKILVLCSIDDVIDDFSRIFHNLPDTVRYSCLKNNKAKTLSKESKEIINCFKDGVLNVLVISSLTDEIFELNIDLVISLEPNKQLFKCADPRFSEGFKKCTFIVTRGAEHNKFEMILNEKKNEQKCLNIDPTELPFKDGPLLFPEDFDPEFKRSGVAVSAHPPKDTVKKSLLDYFNTSLISEKSDFVNVDKYDKLNKNDLAQIKNNENIFEFENDSIFAEIETPGKKHNENGLNFENDSIFVDIETPGKQNCSNKSFSCINETSESIQRENDYFRGINDVEKVTILDKESQELTHSNRVVSPELFDDEDSLPTNELSNLNHSLSHDDTVCSAEVFNNCENDRKNVENNSKSNCLNRIIKPQFSKISKESLNVCDLATSSKNSSIKSSSMFTSISMENIHNENFCDSLFDNSPTDRIRNKSSLINIQNQKSITTCLKESLNKDVSNTVCTGVDNFTFTSTPNLVNTDNFSKTGIIRETFAKTFDGIHELRNTESINTVKSKITVNISDLKNITFVDDLFMDDAKSNENIVETSHEITESSENKSIVSRVQCSSPILFSSKKTNRKRAKLSMFKTIKGDILNFNSTVNTTDENLLQLDSFILASNTTEIEKDKVAEPCKEVESTKKCFPFDDGDEIFMNLNITNLHCSTPDKVTISKSSNTIEDSVNKINNCFMDSDDDYIYQNENISNKNKLFSNFSASLQKTIEKNEKRIINSKCNIELKDKSSSLVLDDYNDEEFPWLKTSRSSAQICNKNVSNVPLTSKEKHFAAQNDKFSLEENYSTIEEICTFKKPFLVPNASYRNKTPKSNSSSSSNEKAPALKIIRSKANRKKLKRNLVEQFIDAEASVSNDSIDDDDTSVEETSEKSVDSFIDDDSAVPESPLVTNYLKSLKSPKNHFGKFHIPVLSDSKLEMNVYSQFVDETDYQDYEHDSFCVDDVDSEPNYYSPSVLTQAEEHLTRKKKKKIKIKCRKQITINNVTPSPPFKKRRKRIQTFSSSESD